MGRVLHYETTNVFNPHVWSHDYDASGSQPAQKTATRMRNPGQYASVAAVILFDISPHDFLPMIKLSLSQKGGLTTLRIVFCLQL